MDVNTVTEIIRAGLFTIIKCAAPMLLVSLVIGLTVSIFQTVTSIQEQTLTFVPKLIGIFASLMLLGHWIIREIIEFTNQLWSNFALYIR